MVFMSPRRVFMKSDSWSAVFAGRYEVIEAGTTAGGGALGFPRGLSSFASFLFAGPQLNGLSK